MTKKDIIETLNNYNLDKDKIYYYKWSCFSFTKF